MLHINHETELLLTSAFSLSTPLLHLVYQHTVYTHIPAAYSDVAANITTIPCTIGVHALAVLPIFQAHLPAAGCQVVQNLCCSQIQPTAIALNDTIKHIRNDIQLL